MRKTNYIKSTINTILEGKDRWWYLINIAAKYHRDKELEKQPERIKKKYENQFASYVHPTRTYLDENGKLLIPKKEKKLENGKVIKKIAYKCATENDAEYIIKELIRREQVAAGAKERKELCFETVKKTRLLSESKLKQLELNLQLNK